MCHILIARSMIKIAINEWINVWTTYLPDSESSNHTTVPFSYKFPLLQIYRHLLQKSSAKHCAQQGKGFSQIPDNCNAGNAGQRKD
jgi:hypothetical protein